MVVHRPSSIITASDLAGLRLQARRAFGQHNRTRPVLHDIKRKLTEIDADPQDVTGWAAVILLAFDGAMNVGFSPGEVIAAFHDKAAGVGPVDD